jgi:diacylglycerol O-acyltransferase / wax synthase
MIATVMERWLDRERPLWECYVIEGLSDNRWAVLTKIHHCIADGIATTQILAKFSDDRDDRGDSNTFATDIRAAKEPAADEPGRPKLSFNPLSWLGGIARSALAAATTA